MEFRIGRRVPEGEASPAAFRKRAMTDLLDRGVTPGLLGYVDGEPVGWVALGPRSDFPKLQHSPIMRPVDEQPVWVTPCFVVAGDARGRGMATALLRQAIDAAQAAGAPALEGFPVDKDMRSQPQWLWHGTLSMFAQAGFREIARRKALRPVMRLTFA
jgi:GNAT superfamily N-acetyltransferase